MNFPTSPTLNQTYSLGSKTWKWNGVAWDLQSVGLTSSMVTTALGYTPYNAASLSTDLAPYLLSATAASTYTTKTNPTTTGTLKNTGGRSYFGPNGEVYAVGVGYNATRVNAGQVFYIGGTDSANPDLVFSEAAGSERLRLTSLGSFGLGTSSPSKKFVVSNAGANGLEFQPDDAVTYGYNRLLSYNRSTLAYTPLVMQASEFRLWTGQIAERFVLDGSGNLGLGVTPSAWGGGVKGFEMPNNGAINFAGNYGIVSGNAYFNGTNWIRNISANASFYYQANGSHQWHIAGNGIAGSTISFTQAMTLDASGNLGVGTTTPDARLDVTRSGNGQIAVLQTSANRGFSFDSQSDTALQIGSIQGSTNLDLWANTLSFSAGGSERARISAAGGFSVGTTADPGAGAILASGNITAYSDERLKTDWSALPSDFIERLARVKNGTYTRIDSGQRQAGSSAQDWKALLPEAVLTGDDKNQTLSLAYGNAALVSAVELAKRVVRLEAQINAMIGD